MAYTPTNWATGDTVTATKLNKLEQGVANAGGGFDAEISLYGDSQGSQGTIISGSYAELSALLNNNIAPNILVRVWFSNYSGINLKGTTTATVLYGYYPDYSEPFMMFVYKVPTNGTGGNYVNEWVRRVFNWYSTDVIEDF